MFNRHRLHTKMPKVGGGKNCASNGTFFKKTLFVQSCLIYPVLGGIVWWESVSLLPTGSCTCSGKAGAGVGELRAPWPRAVNPPRGANPRWAGPPRRGGGGKGIGLKSCYFCSSSLLTPLCATSFFQKLFNNKSFNTSVKYLISGPGVNEPPEVGLFSIEDDENGHVYVHRTIDREKTSIFQVIRLKKKYLRLLANINCFFMARCFTRVRHTAL